MDEGDLRVEPPCGRVVVRPGYGYLLASAAMLIVALTLGPLMLLGAAQEASLDFMAAALAILFWALVAGVSASTVTARAVADESGLTYRCGLIHYDWAPSQIRSIIAVEGHGFGYRRLCLEVSDAAGKSRRLWALQRPARSTAGVAELEDARNKLVTLLGLAQRLPHA